MGLAHRFLDNVTSIGIDEVQIHKGHKYATLVYQIDSGNKRLLDVVEERKESSLEHFFTEFDEGTEGEERRSQKVRWVCSDMWCPYLNVIARVCTKAKNVLARFHIKGHLTNAVNVTRQLDVKKLQSEGRESVLLKSKSIFLKNPANLTAEQSSKLSELLHYNLRVIRSYLLKEDFERFWAYRSGYWAGRFLDDWCCRVMRSRFDPMKKFVGLVRGHRELLMNWFSSKGMSSGVVEGFNNKVKLTTRKSYGFQSFESLRIALFHALGNLPQPEYTHRFW